jgi:hypothetical protein
MLSYADLKRTNAAAVKQPQEPCVRDFSEFEVQFYEILERRCVCVCVQALAPRREMRAACVGDRGAAVDAEHLWCSAFGVSICSFVLVARGRQTLTASSVFALVC